MLRFEALSGGSFQNRRFQLFGGILILPDSFRRRQPDVNLIFFAFRTYRIQLSRNLILPQVASERQPDVNLIFSSV